MRICAVFICFFLFSFSTYAISSEKIDINTAPLEELIKIIHIGEARAIELISLRPFRSLDDLARIKGIGEKRVEEIKKEGLAWVNIQESLINQIKTEPETPIKLKTEETKPKIILSYPEKNPVNKEIKVQLYVFGLKDALYDIKIAIEKEGVISDIYNKKEEKWHSSHYYLNEIFSGSFFEETFSLKIKEKSLNFEGEADILARIRESGKSNYINHSAKIYLVGPEPLSFFQEEQKLATANKSLEKNEKRLQSFSVLLAASSLALFSGTTILILKNKLKPINKQ